MKRVVYQLQLQAQLKQQLQPQQTGGVNEGNEDSGAISVNLSHPLIQFCIIISITMCCLVARCIILVCVYCSKKAKNQKIAAMQWNENIQEVITMSNNKTQDNNKTNLKQMGSLSPTTTQTSGAPQFTDLVMQSESRSRVRDNNNGGVAVGGASLNDDSENDNYQEIEMVKHRVQWCLDCVLAILPMH